MEQRLGINLMIPNTGRDYCVLTMNNVIPLMENSPLMMQKMNLNIDFISNGVRTPILINPVTSTAFEITTDQNLEINQEFRLDIGGNTVTATISEQLDVDRYGIEFDNMDDIALFFDAISNIGFLDDI